MLKKLVKYRIKRYLVYLIYNIYHNKRHVIEINVFSKSILFRINAWLYRSISDSLKFQAIKLTFWSICWWLTTVLCLLNTQNLNHIKNFQIRYHSRHIYLPTVIGIFNLAGWPIVHATISRIVQCNFFTFICDVSIIPS